MPQIINTQNTTYHIGVWKIEEDESFFINRLNEEQTQLPELTMQRRLQSLAARYLLTQMLEEENTVYKNDRNQPYLKNDQRYISISHSFDVAAVLVAHRACGIDIEKNLPRIERIAPKFLNMPELERLKGSNFRSLLYRIWGAKEAMFKAYGLGQIDFKHDLWVDLEAVLDNKKVFTCRLLNHPHEILFEMQWLDVLSDYTVVYGSTI